MNMQRLRQQLIEHEGVELKPYRCTNEDIDICINELQQTLSYWNDLPSRVKEGLINLCFNMGISSLMAFKRTFSYLRSGDFGKAADELLDSRYANQVGQRAVDVADMIRDGANN